MSVMKKYLIMSLVLLMAFSSLSTSVTYAEKSSDVSSLFSDFIDNAFNNLRGLRVIDSNGVDITEDFIDKASNYSSSKNYKAIHKLISKQDLSVSYRVIESKEVSDDDAVHMLGFYETVTVKDYFYHLETESTGKYTKEWQTSLTGTYTYNVNTHEIYSSQSPVLTLESASFGYGFSPYMSNISTDDSIRSTSVKFSGSYTMNATLSVALGGLPLGFHFDFGRHTDYFIAEPPILW